MITSLEKWTRIIQCRRAQSSTKQKEIIIFVLLSCISTISRISFASFISISFSISSLDGSFLGLKSESYSKEGLSSISAWSSTDLLWKFSFDIAFLFDHVQFVFGFDVKIIFKGRAFFNICLVIYLVG